MKNSYIFGIFFATFFFIVGLLTISHYGLNIDEPAHFTRGHAYLSFLLTGKEKYSKNELALSRVSSWKIKQYDASYYLKKDSGHPPLNGILAAITNKIFYEKLGIIGDLQSYHLFEIFVSSLLVFLIFVIARREYGVFAGVVAALSLSLYPLFLGESRFNIKDPIEASFFAYTVYFFYLGLEKTQGRYFFFSSIFCAFAFGTKFNIVFLPFIIILYLIIRYFPVLTYENYRKLKKVPLMVYMALITYPIIVFGIHFLTRPFLWSDPINNFLKIIQYYQEIGTGSVNQPDFIFNGWNTYPVVFIVISTPFIILLFLLVGVVRIFSQILRERKKFGPLLLLWFAVPIIRVMWPGTSIYGGVRHIMEYVPAVAILAGIGGSYIVTLLHCYIVKLKKQLNNRVIKQLNDATIKALLQLIIILSFIPITIKLISIHPNENLFMNSLIGGLKGAVERKIPGAGESMGNVYLQGIWWLNEHAERDALVGTPVGLASNIPHQFARQDIQFGPSFSGMKRSGEYMMEMVSVDFPPPRYNFQYLDKFLVPAYTVNVDKVPVLKIWKNDLTYTKKGYVEEEQKNIEKIVKGEKGSLEIYLENPAFITRLEVFHEYKDCMPEGDGKIYFSDGKNIMVAPDNLFYSQGTYANSLQTRDKFIYFFPAPPADWIEIEPEDSSLCLLRYNNIKVFGLRDLEP